MDALKRSRSSIKGSLTKSKGIVEKLTLLQVTLSEVQLRIEKLDQISDKFEKIQTEIEELCEDEDAAEEVEQRSAFEEEFIVVKTKLMQLKAGLVGDGGAGAGGGGGGGDGPQPRQQKQSVRLLKMDIKPFTGQYSDWVPFFDMFTSIVDDSKELSDVQKLQYLRGLLSGEPAKLIQSLQITSANYGEAKKLLCERYENKRQLVNAHLKALFGMPAIVTESAVGLRNLLVTTDSNIQALKVLGQPTEQWDTMLVYMVVERLDPDSRRHWELAATTADPPKYADLKTFLDKRCRALEAAPPKTKQNQQPVIRQVKTMTAVTPNDKNGVETCVICCSTEHQIYKCEQFLKLTVAERVELIKERSLCFNCLKDGGHTAQNCRSGTCRKCRKRHNTLLHFNSQQQSPKVGTGASHGSVASGGATAEPPVHNHFSNDSKIQILLSTASVRIYDCRGVMHVFRALIDSGSQANFVTDSLVQTLGLRRKGCSAPVLGIGTQAGVQSRGQTEVEFKSIHSSFSMNINAIILSKITGNLPNSIVDLTSWPNIRELNLADSGFDKPGPVDLLLGAEVFARIVGGDKMHLQNGPYAFQTELGWIFAGKYVPATTEVPTSAISVHLVTSTTLDDQLKRFWELEEVSSAPKLTVEEQACEDSFLSTFERDNSGRYIVQLPLKSEIGQSLGESRSQAARRLQQLERRLSENPVQRQQYVQFMDEYEQLGHMRRIEGMTSDTVAGSAVYYLPHHAVFKESSSTTKLRVVFDASAKTSSGTSLNDNLLVGPRTQSTLLDILLRFRFNKIAFTADIEKMYRQILVSDKHQDLQRIVWRPTPEQPIEEYRLTTVTYGTASAPYLATRTLVQLAVDEGEKWPRAARSLQRDFYVDDVMSGAHSVEEAVDLQEQLNEILSAGGFHLRKWASNCSELLNAVPVQDRENQAPLVVPSDDSIKTLGIIWHSNCDEFSISIQPVSDSQCTKRRISSDIARLFDPMGWLSPVVILAKIILQKLWILGLSWDVDVPQDIQNVWKMFREGLLQLDQVRIRRFVDFAPSAKCELHGFCDASERAYGCVVYLRVIHPDGKVAVHILCSKTRVAPVKQVSLPRLELCGAVLLARLVKWVMEASEIQFDSVHAWTDSTIVLAWLAELPSKWKTFVANRVSEIQGILPRSNWSHVKSGDNPADSCSRGIMPGQIVNNNLWWSGPEWLQQRSYDVESTESREEEESSNQEEEIVLSEQSKSKPVFGLTVKIDESMLSQFSTLGKLVRITAYCLRFIHNCRVKKEERVSSFLTAAEREKALQVWIRNTQEIAFGEEIDNLSKGQPVDKTSKIIALAPFLDQEGILRVGGRLENADMAYAHKHPVILPGSPNKLSALIVADAHVKYLHAGPTHLLSVLRQKFWILRARNLIRSHIHKCLPCFRDKVRCAEQQMGNLPAPRVNVSRPFANCGVDYAGPVMLRAKTGRGRFQSQKAYIALFICFAVKAIHLEVVTDLSTKAFLGAFRRFIGRRSSPSHMYSDCGTNFVGANRELQELREFVKSENFQNVWGNELASENIQWHFNPPASPHFGGLWEAGVKSVKQHLRRVVGSTIFTFEELDTMCIQIEACLNSRPLCASSSDPNDFSSLTPSHFLVGDAPTLLPEPDLTTTKESLLDRWKLVQQRVQSFWKRWYLEYLSNLQQRGKWKSKKENLQVNDLVLVKVENVPPSKWPLARVVEVSNGSDGLVRVVTVKTKSGVVGFNGSLYVIGGDDVSSGEVYNPLTGTWTMLPMNMQFHRLWFNVMVIDY